MNTGEFTERSSIYRFIIKDDIRANKVWYSNINISFESAAFNVLYNKVIQYLNTKELIVCDTYA